MHAIIITRIPAWNGSRETATSYGTCEAGMRSRCQLPQVSVASEAVQVDMYPGGGHAGGQV